MRAVTTVHSGALRSATKMSEEQNAVALIFEQLASEGIDWYRNSGEEGVSFFSTRLQGTYALVDKPTVSRVRHTRNSSFRLREIALLRPPEGHPAPLLAVWLRWNFDATPAKCGFYTGLWTRIETDHRFIGFRFETPEEGEQHGFYHCQPCRNLGDRESDEATAVPISQRVPTLALHAENSAELALNIVLSMRGKLGLEKFRRDLFKASPHASRNPVLLAGFRRLRALPAIPVQGPVEPAEVAVD